jgi:hypothetical protein
MGKLQRFGLFAGMVVILSAYQPSPTFLNPVSFISSLEANLYKTILIMALVVFVLSRPRTSWPLPERNSRISTCWWLPRKMKSCG